MTLGTTLLSLVPSRVVAQLRAVLLPDPLLPVLSTRQNMHTQCLLIPHPTV